ncbi:MAG TPA: DUF4240 domain-containing protein [Abditibacterium sp.]|jgi:hypothetical protein
MTLDEFWNFIERSRRGAEDDDELVDNLRARLEKLPAEEVAEWGRIFNSRLNEAFRWDLWAVADIMHQGNCGVDSFEDWRGWLISKGRKHFERALLNPESAAYRVNLDDQIYNEDILRVAHGVYEEKTGEPDIPDDPWILYGCGNDAYPSGTELSNSQLIERFPKLCAKFEYEPPKENGA